MRFSSARLLLLMAWLATSFTLAAEIGDTAVVGKLYFSGAELPGQLTPEGAGWWPEPIWLLWLMSLGSFFCRFRCFALWLLALLALQLKFVIRVDDSLLWSSWLVLLLPTQVLFGLILLLIDRGEGVRAQVITLD
ncbi:MAG: hypothetical protein ACK5M8_03675 [Shewanella algae]